jgi:ribonuclease HI
MTPSKKSDKKMLKESKPKITGSGGLSGGGVYKSLDKLNRGPGPMPIRGLGDSIRSQNRTMQRQMQKEMRDKHRKMMNERMQDQHQDKHRKIMDERMQDQHNKMMQERIQDQHNKMMNERMQDQHNKMMMQNQLMRRRPARTGTTPSKAGERRIRQ